MLREAEMPKKNRKMKICCSKNTRSPNTQTLTRRTWSRSQSPYPLRWRPSSKFSSTWKRKCNLWSQSWIYPCCKHRTKTPFNLVRIQTQKPTKSSKTPKCRTQASSTSSLTVQEKSGWDPPWNRAPSLKEKESRNRCPIAQRKSKTLKSIKTKRKSRTSKVSLIPIQMVTNSEHTASNSRAWTYLTTQYTCFVKLAPNLRLFE